MDVDRIEAVGQAVAGALEAGGTNGLHARLGELGVHEPEVFEALQDVERLEPERAAEVASVLKLAAEALATPEG
jgi:hypothetical protein